MAVSPSVATSATTGWWPGRISWQWMPIPGHSIGASAARPRRPCAGRRRIERWRGGVCRRRVHPHRLHAATRVAKLDIDTGQPVAGFSTSADSKVRSLVPVGDRVFVGGSFNAINGSTRSNFGAVDATSGALDPNVDLPITDPTGRSEDGGIRAMAATSDGSRMMLLYNAATIGGVHRQGVAQVDLTTSPVSVSPWSTSLYDYQCKTTVPRPLMRDLAISPDDSYAVVVTSGDNYPPGCDTAVAFPVAASGPVQPLWVNKMRDTLEAVAISDSAVMWGTLPLGRQRRPQPFPGGGPEPVRRACSRLGPFGGWIPRRRRAQRDLARSAPWKRWGYRWRGAARPVRLLRGTCPQRHTSGCVHRAHFADVHIRRLGLFRPGRLGDDLCLGVRRRKRRYRARGPALFPSGRALHRPSRATDGSGGTDAAYRTVVVASEPVAIAHRAATGTSGQPLLSRSRCRHRFSWAMPWSSSSA